MSSKAVGLIETIGLAAAIEAADAASKAANITLLGYENSKGGGMITVKLVGDVGAVKAAVSAGSAAAQRVGKIAATHIIPRPHSEIEPLITSATRGKKTEAPKTKAKPATAKPKRTRSQRATKAKSTSTRKKAAPKSAKPSQPEDSLPEQSADTPPAETGPSSAE
jgi:microcompartment protein CcmL/EutN